MITERTVSFCTSPEWAAATLAGMGLLVLLLLGITVIAFGFAFSKVGQGFRQLSQDVTLLPSSAREPTPGAGTAHVPPTCGSNASLPVGPNDLCTVSLSTKALRFVILAVESEMERMRAALARPELDEDEAAELGNDLRYYEAILPELKRGLQG